MKKEELAIEFFNQGSACAQAIVLAFAEEIGLDKDVARRISAGFGGGISRLRETCGAITGSAMILSYKYDIPLEDFDTRLKCYGEVQEFADKFKEKYKTISCRDLINKYATEDQVKKREHHKLVCIPAIKHAAILLDEMLRNNNQQDVK